MTDEICVLAFASTPQGETNETWLKPYVSLVLLTPLQGAETDKRDTVRFVSLVRLRARPGPIRVV